MIGSQERQRPFDDGYDARTLQVAKLFVWHERDTTDAHELVIETAVRSLDAAWIIGPQRRYSHQHAHIVAGVETATEVALEHGLPDSASEINEGLRIAGIAERLARELAALRPTLEPEELVAGFLYATAA